MLRVLKALALLAAAYAAGSRIARHVLGSPTKVGPTTIGPLLDDTTIDEDGVCHSVQSADMRMPSAALQAIWTPKHLERLARTYWRFLSRCTLGLVRVEYTDGERFVVLVSRPLVLLAFKAPEYEMDAGRGVVRWRIDHGLLLAPPGMAADGYLEIDARRRDTADAGWSQLHVEVEVANYHPAIAWKLTRWIYAVTQSRIHVLVTYGFLRSLAKLDLDESRIGRFAELDEVPQPRGPGPSERSAERPARHIPSATPR